MARKNPEITQETIRRIKEAFWELYTEKPLEKISVREITMKAGYNHATFYLYFQNVRDVLNQIEADLLTRRDQVLADVTRNGSLDFSGILFVMGDDFLPYAKVLLGPHGDKAFEEDAKERIWPYLKPLLYPVAADGTSTEPASETGLTIAKQFYLSGILGAIKAILKNPDITAHDIIDFVTNEVLPHAERQLRIREIEEK